MTRVMTEEGVEYGIDVYVYIIDHKVMLSFREYNNVLLGSIQDAWQ